MNLTNEPKETMVEKRICLPIFNRATYARVKTVVEEISRKWQLELTLVVSGSLLEEEFGSAHEYITNGHQKILIERLSLPTRPPGHAGSAMRSGDIIHGLTEILEKKKFDLVIIVADRYEMLPAALCAAYLNIPIVHIQGGEMTGNIDDKVRHAITRLADYHFVSTDMAKIYLNAMGEDFKTISSIGCPSLDLIKQAGIKRHEPKDKYLFCVFHPETERPESAYEETRIVFDAVIEHCARSGTVCYWFWPNNDPGRSEVVRMLDEALKSPLVSPWIRKFVNLPPVEFLKRLSGARMVVGNSSVGIRESSFIGVPSVNIGGRQRSRERSWNVMDVGLNQADIMKAMAEQDRIGRYKRSFLYGCGETAGELVNRIITRKMKLKDGLCYPFMPQFKEQHFGSARLDKHGRKNKRFYYPETIEAAAKAREQGNLCGEPVSSTEGDGAATGTGEVISGSD